MSRIFQNINIYRLLVVIFVMIVAVIGCTRFGSRSSSIDDSNAAASEELDSPRPNQRAVLPVPVSTTSAGSEKIFAPILMDSDQTQAKTENIGSFLSRTVTTTRILTAGNLLATNEVTPPAVLPEASPVDQLANPALSLESGSQDDTPTSVIEAEDGITQTLSQTNAVTMSSTTALSTTVLSTTVLSTTALTSPVLETPIITTSEIATTALTTTTSVSVTTQGENSANLVEGDSDGSGLQQEESIESIRVERTVNVPILMYHYLSVPPADADIYRLDLSVTPEQFSLHLDSMLDAGYTTISLFDLWNHLENGVALPPKPVVLTFDDGYLDNYENAFPLLIQRGMTATFFIVTGFIEEGRGGYITWPMVEEMYDAGMSIESHSTRHFSLKNRDDEFLIFEALRTKEIIEAKIGIAPRFVSYPAGEYDQNTIKVFDSAGYLMGVTTIQGGTHSNDNLFELRRVRIRGTTDETELLRLLELEW